MPFSSTSGLNTRTHKPGPLHNTVSSLFQRGKTTDAAHAVPGHLAIPLLEERAANPALLKLTVNTAWPVVVHTAAVRPALGILFKDHGVERGTRISQWLNALDCAAPVAKKALHAVEKMPGAIPVDVACAAMLLRTISLKQCRAMLPQLFHRSDIAAALSDPSRTEMVARFRQAAWRLDPRRDLGLEFAVIERQIAEGIPPDLACVSMLYPVFEKNWAKFIAAVMPHDELPAEFDSEGIDPLASPHSTVEPMR